MHQTSNQEQRVATVDPEQQIEQLRSQLDVLNLHLLRVLEARGKIVCEIMALKREIGRAPHDPVRERGMLDELMKRAADVYSPAALERIFSTIFAESRKLCE